MPYALVFTGIVLVVATIRGNLRFLGRLLAAEFVGTGSFLYWLVAIMLIGSVGYIRPLKPLSDAFIGLLLLVFLLKNGSGFFDKFNEAIRQIASGNLPDAPHTDGVTDPSPAAFPRIAPLAPMTGET